MESAMDDARDLYEPQPSLTELRLRNTEARLARLIEAAELYRHHASHAGICTVCDQLQDAIEEAKKP
jgi:hypothetical protein